MKWFDSLGDTCAVTYAARDNRSWWDQRRDGGRDWDRHAYLFHRGRERLLFILGSVAEPE
jgi:hypothetical protein